MKFSRSRRGASLVAAFAGLALAVSACGGGSSGGGDGAAASEGGTLTVANWQWLEPGRGDTLWQAVQQYEQVNGKAQLNKSATAFAQYADKLNTELGAKGGPDVFMMMDFQFATLARAGLLEPLDDTLDGVDLNGSNEAGKYDGKQLGVTWEQVNYGLIWNKDLLARAGVQPPTTVDELIAAGKAIKEKTGADGFGVRHQMSELDGWFQDFNSWVYGYGGAWSAGDQLSLDSSAVVEGVSAYKKVYDSGIMPIGDDASTMRTKFKEGRLGMMIDNSGATLSMSSGGKITGDQIGAGPLPFPQPGSHQQLILAVNKNGKNKNLARDFVKWLVSEQGQTAIRPGLGASTLATDVPLDPGFAAANPWAEEYGKLSAGSKSALIAGFEEKTKPIMKDVMTAVERVITQGEDPAAAMKLAQEQAKRTAG